MSELLILGLGVIALLVCVAFFLWFVSIVFGILFELLGFLFKVICFPFALAAVTLAMLDD